VSYRFYTALCRNLSSATSFLGFTVSGRSELRNEVMRGLGPYSAYQVEWTAQFLRRDRVEIDTGNNLEPENSTQFSVALVVVLAFAAVILLLANLPAAAS
jgi:hypothetical protein